MKRLVQYFFPENNGDVLKAFVKEVIKINKQYPYINYGGCGVFAERLYDKLKLFGYKPKIVVLVNSKQCFADSMKMLDERGLDYYWINRTEGFSHIMVKVNGYYVDSEGMYKSQADMPSKWRYYDIYEKGMKIGSLRKCTADERFWNDRFDRYDIPAIENRLDSIYRRIAKKIKTNSLVVS